MYTEDKIKIILEQQAGSRDLSTFTAITREMNGADLKPFTRSTMEVKEEEGCHTDMHKLEDREIWKVLLVKPRWHSEGEQGKEPNGRSTGSGGRGGFWTRASRDSWLLTLSALLRILQGVLLALGAEPGKGTGDKRERQKIKSYNGNINCLSCGFYKTHKMFSFCLFFFFYLWIGALPFCMENTSMGFTAQLQGSGLTVLASFGHIFSFNE